MGKALSPEATQVERAAAYEAAYNNRARVPGDVPLRISSTRS